MTDDALRGRKILVVEDEYLIADDLHDALKGMGAEVVGPIPTLADAMACVGVGTLIDAAVLDVNLRGEMIFPVADALVARGVPLVFVTGYDTQSLPDRFANTIQLEKPLKSQKVAAALALLLPMGTPR
jgi:DNA-binding response OmpR family regulator